MVRVCYMSCVSLQRASPTIIQRFPVLMVLCDVVQNRRSIGGNGMWEGFVVVWPYLKTTLSGNLSPTWRADIIGLDSKGVKGERKGEG